MMGRYVRLDPEVEMKIYNLHYGEEQLNMRVLGERFGVRQDRIKDVIMRINTKLGRKGKNYGKGTCDGRNGGVVDGNRGNGD